jgi:hypothetical protein
VLVKFGLVDLVTTAHALSPSEDEPRLSFSAPSTRSSKSARWVQQAELRSRIMRSFAVTMVRDFRRSADARSRQVPEVSLLDRILGETLTSAGKEWIGALISITCWQAGASELSITKCLRIINSDKNA